jgi:tRNA(Met) cytidine acetyltransferase
VLLVPPLADWADRPDSDSLRWSDSAEPIATPHFVHHFAGRLPPIRMRLSGSSIAFVLPVAPIYPTGSLPAAPQREQAEILDALLAMPAGIAAVTAPRGRGKSALAGMLLNSIRAVPWSRHRRRGQRMSLRALPGEHFHFMAPDALLASTLQADWLIVDEAAAIPGPLLEKLVTRFPRVLLTTTVQGYEGTGGDSC